MIPCKYFSVDTWYYLNLMLINMPNICWRSFTSCSMYSPSNQLQGSFTQRVDLWSTSCSQAARHHARIGSVDFSVKKNVKSSQLQNVTCFVGLEQHLKCRLSARRHILNVKSDILSHQNVSSVNWSLGSMPQRIGCVVSGLGFAVSGLASAEGPVNNNIDSTKADKSSTNLSHGKKVYTDYSVTGEIAEVSFKINAHFANDLSITSNRHS